VAKLRLTDSAKSDIRNALAFTLERFGAVKLEQYKELIDAQRAISRDPGAGTARPDIGEGAMAYRLTQPGTCFFIASPTPTRWRSWRCFTTAWISRGDGVQGERRDGDDSDGHGQRAKGGEVCSGTGHSLDRRYTSPVLFSGNDALAV
jgi:plasmid stabilization system protein ParE